MSRGSDWISEQGHTFCKEHSRKILIEFSLTVDEILAQGRCHGPLYHDD